MPKHTDTKHQTKNISTFTGFKTLLRRECSRFLSLFNQTLFPSVVNTLLYITVFGYFLGRRISDMNGFSYITYIFPGLLMMTVVISSFQNTSTSIFVARQENFIDDLLVAPITYGQMVLAYVIAACARGTIIAILSIIVCSPLAKVSFTHPFLFIVSIMTCSVFFACCGLIAGMWGERWEHIAVISNYIITPLVFLGGVFYSASTVPTTLQWIIQFNPLFYMVSSIRHSLLGTADIPFIRAYGVTFVLAAISFAIVVQLFKKGYKLRS